MFPRNEQEFQDQQKQFARADRIQFTFELAGALATVVGLVGFIYVLMAQ